MRLRSLCIDTARGSRIIKHRGIAISNIIKFGYILRASDDLLSLPEAVAGELAHVLALSPPDITPYGNGLTHLSGILQPATDATQPPTWNMPRTSP